MKIIRDEDTGGLMMIPLFVDWNIRRCNVVACPKKPNTIITNCGPDVPIVGLCETHFQEGNADGGTKYSLEWDDYDAFKVVVP